MDFSHFEEITGKIESEFGENSIRLSEPNQKQPFLQIDSKDLLKICNFLYSNEHLYFDLLNCITVVDNGPEDGSMEVWYHLTSIPFEKSFILKLVTGRGTDKEPSQIDSVSSIWKTADWHEREAFDLFGLEFTNHPDLRRILLPADWQGHPLRKDYEEQEKYHGIKVKY